MLDRHALWVELKAIEHWTPKLGVNPKQYLWARRMSKAGGRLFLLARVGKECILVEGAKLRSSGMGRAQWLKRARCYWPNGIDWIELRRALTVDPVP
jgi:hypothetical protein